MPRKKSSNATWIARTAVDPASPDIDYPLEGTNTGEAPTVIVYWYPGGKVRIILRGAAPRVISQAFLPGKGQDVIVEFAPSAPTTLPSPEEPAE
jgi:hypothetical protein